MRKRVNISGFCHAVPSAAHVKHKREEKLIKKKEKKRKKERKKKKKGNCILKRSLSSQSN